VTIDSWLVFVCVSRSFAMFMSMTYAGTLTVLRSEWAMSATAAGSISSSFQLGYAVSLVAFSVIADRVGARRVFQWSLVASAIAALAFAMFARSYVSGLLLYTLIAISQGGLYTTAIMLMSQRYPPDKRGGAVGWLIASSSAGYVMSLILCGVMLRHGGYPAAFLATAGGPVLSVIIAWPALRGTSNVVHSAEGRPRFGGAVFKNRSAMRLIIGYTGHSWELLGMWAWIPAFLAASFAESGAGLVRAAELGAYSSASFHVMGVIASSSMGWLSDKIGVRRILITLATVSAACSFFFGWLIGFPAFWVLGVGALYAFTAIGDSPILSSTLTQVVNAPSLGAALGFRSLLGFGAGAIAPLAFGVVLDHVNALAGTRMAWGWAFVVLGLGGLVAIWAAVSVRTEVTTSGRSA
jgi:MFS family permease